MTHTIISDQPLGNRYWRVVVELQPATPTEAAAIRNVAQVKATEEERAQLTNYLLFNLGLQVVDVLNHESGNRVVLKVFR
jgi:hypothetical protein